MDSIFLRNLYTFYQNTLCRVTADSKRQLKFVVYFFLKKRPYLQQMKTVRGCRIADNEIEGRCFLQ